MPDERLFTLHLAIEYAVAHTLRRFKNMQDKDIEWVYEKYRNYFLAVRQGKEPAEPDSTRSDRSELTDYLWECLLKWEDASGPEGLLDGSFRHGNRTVTTVEELYVIAFNDLRKSCRIRRQMDGPRGYVKHAQEWVAEVIAEDPELLELLDPAVPANKLNLEYLLDKRGYQVSLSPARTGIPAIDQFLFDDGELEEPYPEDFELLLERYPDDPSLKAEYAITLESEDRADEALPILREVAHGYPEVPYFVGIYLESLMDANPDQVEAEAERLRFRPNLADYPYDAEDGYSVPSLLAHSAFSIRTALGRQDLHFALDLLNDLIKSGLPEELLLDISKSVLVHQLTDNEERSADSSPLNELFEQFPQFDAALEMIGEQLAELIQILGLDGLAEGLFDEDLP